MVGDIVGDVTKAVPLLRRSHVPARRRQDQQQQQLGLRKLPERRTGWHGAVGQRGPQRIHSSYPPQAGGTPSRPSAYDVYRYELNTAALLSHAWRTARSARPRQAAASAIRSLDLRITRRTNTAIAARSSPRSSIVATRHRLIISTATSRRRRLPSRACS